ncbi:response regulator transcription factor [Caballeronia sp. LZ025]|uniref:response regulator transcription factor n=1 Tax=Caballeronia TaxID=1827195 RepID=UPI001FCF9167|nr:MULTISPECIES: response regulator transcription factor [Caballeronia]MDR5733954.1 response regulator transcription factor [Caballeronia sp. LZ025]
MTDTRLLLVEDDPEIRASLADFLRGKGLNVEVADSAEAAHGVLARGAFDLILLDVMLPGEDGLSFCRRVRASGGPPIIMLTALGEPTDKVVGLELGADDYVTKPFDLRELLARIRAVLRRGQTQTPTRTQPGEQATELVMEFSGFTFYPYRRFLRSPKGLRVPLTGAETDLLLVFCQNARQVLSREQLIGLTRGKDFPIAARSVDLLVSRLRRKLQGNDPLDDPIRTMRADGYAFQPEVKTV